jgi:hypothetical protein
MRKFTQNHKTVDEKLSEEFINEEFNKESIVRMIRLRHNLSFSGLNKLRYLILN